MNKFKYHFLLAIIGMTIFGSCKKDDMGSKELLVYVQGEFGSVNNIVTAALTRTPTAVWGATTFNIPVVATREVPVDVNVFLEPSSQLVGTFNKLNDKKAVLLPANTYTITNAQHSLKSGSFVSQMVSVNITNTAALTDTNGYPT